VKFGPQGQLRCLGKHHYLDILFGGVLFTEYFYVCWRYLGLKLHTGVLSSNFVRILLGRGPQLSVPSDSVLCWPLVTPSSADCRALSAPEVEVVQLFDELRDRLLRYLLALGLSAHDGEEIIQESFLLLFQHLQRGKSGENLRGWIFCVARNLALKQRAANQLKRLRTVQFEDASPKQHLDGGWNPEETFESKQRQTRLLAVVRALSEQDQTCLYLRSEGLRYREIAQVMGISLGSVAASLARSLAKLGRADKVHA
jgi:RNA polymerase sigma-70 factor, ECF subfamily